MRNQHLRRARKDGPQRLVDKLDLAILRKDIPDEIRTLLYDAHQALVEADAKTVYSISFDYEPTRSRISLYAPSKQCFEVILTDYEVNRELVRMLTTPSP